MKKVSLNVYINEFTEIMEQNKREKEALKELLLKANIGLMRNGKKIYADKI
jgi:hypothetical protein